MDNAELMNELMEVKKQKTQIQEEAQEEFVKLLVFQINEKKYALYSDDIREIVMELSVFYLPFVPVYITGFINRHGEPYTVVDLNMLFEQKKLSASTFLILNSEDDQIALLISDVVEIKKVNKKNVHLITAQDTNEDYFSGSITSGDESETLILNIQNILRRLENDIEAK